METGWDNNFSIVIMQIYISRFENYVIQYVKEL